MNQLNKVYSEYNTEYNQYLNAKLASIKLLHTGKLVKWSTTPHGLDVNVCEDLKEGVKLPLPMRCRCVIQKLD